VKAKLRRLAWLLPFVTALALYSPMRHAGFVWDDAGIFGGWLTQFDSLEDYLAASWVAERGAPTGTMARQHFYPLARLSLKLDERIGDALVDPTRPLLDPARARVPHATTVLVHALDSLLVTLLAWQLLSGLHLRARGALAAGMIFAAHPIHAESVCFIIGRTDSLATLFLIPGVLCALRYRERGDRLALLGAPVCFLLALLCKEVAVTQLVLLPLLYRFAPYGGRAFGVREPTAGDGPPRPSGWHLVGPHAAAFAVYLLLRGAVSGSAGMPFPHDPLLLVQRAPAALAYYLKQALVPWPQFPFVTELPGAAFTAAVLLVWAVVLLGSVRAWRRGLPIFLVANAWFAVTLAPAFLMTGELSVVPLAERYLYLPSVALALGLGALLALGGERPRLRRPTAAAAVALLLAYGAATLSQTRVWQSDVGFWERVVRDEAAARHPTPWFNLGLAYQQAARPVEALEALQRAVRDLPGDAHALWPRQVMAGIRLERGIEAFRRRDLEAVLEETAVAEGLLLEVERLSVDQPFDPLERAKVRFLRASALQRLAGRRDTPLLEQARADALAAMALGPERDEALALVRASEAALAEARAGRGEDAGADRR
jgi:tetratricopeptide (TPR) repeat protein